MKFASEEEMLEAAGEAPLTDVEIESVATSTVAACIGLVARCLITKDFSDLKLRFKQNLEHARKKKALLHWIDMDHSYYDPHRRKWLIND